MINLTKVITISKGVTMKQTFTKAVISHRNIEITHQGFRSNTRKTSSGGRKSFSNMDPDSLETNQKISIKRAQRNLRRLLECNFTDTYAFLTLTFNGSISTDITDISNCQKKFNDFKKRVAYYTEKNHLPDFQYIAVIEFQDQNRKGAIHFHVVCNLIKVSNPTLKELWQNGYVHSAIVNSDITENKKIAFYLSKGITDERLTGKKKYYHSRNLKKPLMIDIEDVEEFYKTLNKCQSTFITGGAYMSPFSGETKYENYYINNPKELINYVQNL